MLSSKPVQAIWHGLNRKHYESKGYVYTRQRDAFICKIEDLMIAGRTTVEVECDSCNKIVEYDIKDYVKDREDYLTKIYECRECEIKRVWGNVELKCKELDYSLLSDVSIYKTHKTKIIFICNKHKEYGEKSVTVNDILCKGTGCKQCSNKKKSDNSYRVPFIEIEALFKEKGYILLATSCDNTKEQLDYICPKHDNEVQKICYDKLKIHGCKYCGFEIISIKQKLDFSKVKLLFKEKDLVLLDNEYNYINNMTLLKYICKKHWQSGVQNITYASLKVSDFGCNYCAIGYRSELLSKGGITPLQNYLRDKIDQWKKDSMKSCGYKCVISYGRFDTVHHLYGFNMILLESLSILDLPIYKIIADYSVEELSNIEKTFIELHYKYGFGVCLSKEIHNLFHHFYSKGDNTPEQFEEYKKRYDLGEFIDILKEVS